MLKRLIIAAIGVVGLVVIGLGIASATVWRADDVLVATTSGGPHTLVTEPGVLELGGDPVTVKVTVPDDGNVVLAVGRDTDVAGWVGTDAHGTVTGLSDWHALAVDDVAAPAPTPAPTDEAAAPPADAAARDPLGECGARRGAGRRPDRLRPVGRGGHRDGLRRAGVARPGGALEPARRQHRRVRPDAVPRVASRGDDAVAVAVRPPRHPARPARRPGCSCGTSAAAGQGSTSRSGTP